MVSRLYLTFLLGALASLVVALPRPIPQPAPVESDPTAGRSRECGVHITAKRVSDGERRFRSHRIAPVPENATTTLDVYFHVVYTNETMEGGYVADQRIRDQVDVMNRDYNATGLRWNLKGISRIENSDWFHNIAPESAGEVAMKGLYRKGNQTDLNVYTVGFDNEDASGLLGIATFPMDYAGAPQLDGVMLLHSTIPGSKSRKFSLGRTLVHEAGHWAGLYHTFQGGCEDPGDEIDDTPAQATPSKGCPVNRKTCPGSRGMDPVRNFMDYSDDACMDNFTVGQAKRIKDQLVAYRGAKFA
jgi:hypothetical protein